MSARRRIPRSPDRQRRAAEAVLDALGELGEQRMRFRQDIEHLKVMMERYGAPVEQASGAFRELEEVLRGAKETGRWPDGEGEPEGGTSGGEEGEASAHA